MLSADHEPAAIPISTLVTEVQKTFDLVNESKDLRSDIGLAFDSAEVSVETVAKKADSGKLEFWVVSGKASVSVAKTQVVSFKIVPRKGYTTAGKDFGDQIVPPSEQLAQALLALARDVSQALRSSSTLKAENVSASIKFVVEATATGGSGIELTPVTISTEVSRTSSYGNTIKVTYKVAK